MKKITKLKICDWLLLLSTAAILASGTWLEATGSNSVPAVWIHITIGILFFVLVIYHIFLHFGQSNWFARFHKRKSQATRILWWVAIITFVSGIVAAIHWIIFPHHSPIGGIHGKIGFLMLMFAIGHIFKRLKFFKPK